MKSKCSSPEAKPGEMGYAKDGSLYFRWPKGCKPGKAIGADRGRFKPIILPAKNGVNCVSIACSNIIIRNLTVKYAGNDGFNIHRPSQISVWNMFGHYPVRMKGSVPMRPRKWKCLIPKSHGTDPSPVG